LARNTRPMSITLTHDMAAMVRAKVASGEYATESEVIRDGLRTLQARDAVVQKWLKDKFAKGGKSEKGVDEHMDDLGLGVPAGEALARLRAARRTRSPKHDR
jgi:antitoxin ParD1/3/4